MKNDEQWLLNQRLDDDEYNDWNDWHSQVEQAEQERDEAGE
jgi:hypothetical protein